MLAPNELDQVQVAIQLQQNGTLSANISYFTAEWTNLVCTPAHPGYAAAGT